MRGQPRLARARPARVRPARSRSARRQLGILLAVVAVFVVFVGGVALGLAIHDNPQSGPLVTVEHTVELPPASVR